MTGSFTIARDGHLDLIRVQATGLWTPATADQYYRELQPHVSADRAVYKPLRILIDRRGAATHPDDTLARLEAVFKDFFAMGDRIAGVVDTSLAKMQFRRTYGEEVMQTFMSMSAAQTWLFAHDTVLNVRSGR